jgi:uncharacterized cupredoxin-like copper-binding protein
MIVKSTVGNGDEASAQVVREYNLEIVATDIDYGDGNIWHAWTFKETGDPTGAVPGPTITANVGDKIVVHVKNNLDLVHSFHTHLSGYSQESDGAQTNVISGKGPGAMIPPGGEWTYEFDAKYAGVYYYHCHSADGGLMITDHIHQGLYGGLIVRDPNEKGVRDEVLFMGEMGHLTEGDNVPPYIMNGLGLPGGEHTLELAYREGGFDAVAANLGRTVPTFHAYAGEKLRMSIVNIGDQIHSFHPHNVDIFSVGALGGRQWPANVVPLVQGSADQVTLTFEEPGLWLFHCHVVAHADAGMIGLFVIEEGETVSIEPQGSGTGNVSNPTGPPPTTGVPPPDATPGPDGGDSEVHFELSDFAIGGPATASAGDVEIEAANHGTTPHELVVLRTDTDPAALPLAGTTVDEDAAGTVAGKLQDIQGGAAKRETFTLDAGNYAIICNVPGHYRLGMYASLVVQ